MPSKLSMDESPSEKTIGSSNGEPLLPAIEEKQHGYDEGVEPSTKLLKSSSGRGLVKSILMPAFADSGANDTFMNSDVPQENDVCPDFRSPTSPALSGGQQDQHETGYDDDMISGEKIPMNLQIPLTPSISKDESDQKEEASCSNDLKLDCKTTPCTPMSKTSNEEDEDVKRSPRFPFFQNKPFSLSPRKPHSVMRSNKQLSDTELPILSPLRRAKCWSLDMGEAVAYKNVSPPLSPMNYNHMGISRNDRFRKLPSPSAKSGLRIPILRGSKSWDMTKNVVHPSEDLSPRTSQSSKVKNNLKSTAPPIHRNTEWRKHVVGQGVEARPRSRSFNNHIGDSPDVSGSAAVELMSPQRIEIEREDALDILTCLVDRSVAFHNAKSNDKTPRCSNSSQLSNSSSCNQDKDKIEEKQNRDNKTKTTDGSSSFTQPSSLPQLPVIETIKLLRKLSATIEEGNGQDNNVTHGDRMKVLDELLRCYKYSQEMERAALSASTWLKAIGRPTSNEGTEMDGTLASSQDPLIYSFSTAGTPQKKAGMEVNDGVSSTQENDIMISTLRARFHEAHLKSEENEKCILKLNEELSKCRAEIGRLKTIRRTKHKIPFSSPNRSIFDDDSSECSSNANEDLKLFEDALGKVNIGDSIFSISSDTSNPSKNLAIALKEKAEAQSEILILKSSLLKAKKRVSLLEELNGSFGASEVKGKEDNLDTTVDEQAGEGNENITGENLSSSLDRDFFLDSMLAKELDDYQRALRSADIAVIKSLKSEISLMKSGEGKSDSNSFSGDENYLTEWKEISPLPPPPDHGLHSPIVNTILEQWTNDKSMRESLLNWMASILEANSSIDEDLPLLRLSNLDHRVRDGFIVHVLPLLLRRSDIQINVSSRAQRRTTYDVSVSVIPAFSYAMSSSPLQHQKPNAINLMAFQASKGEGIVEDDENSKPNKQISFNPLSAAEDVRNKVSDLWRNNSTLYKSNNASQLENNVDQQDLPTVYQSFSSNIEEGGESERGKDKIIRAIGGAFGGLLSRRKGQPISKGSMSFDEAENDEGNYLNERRRSFGTGLNDPIEFKRVVSAPARRPQDWKGKYYRQGTSDLPPIPGSPSKGSSRKKPLLLHLDEAEEKNENTKDDLSFHRVVTTPPGRIGVTFVQYRGHAMVSEVSPDSPLVGWIFRSDILVAVDDEAVSGLPVKDIVKIISSKSNSHRALRVVSSHSMQDLTSDLPNEDEDM